MFAKYTFSAPNVSLNVPALLGNKLNNKHIKSTAHFKPKSLMVQLDIMAKNKCYQTEAHL